MIFVKHLVVIVAVGGLWCVSQADGYPRTIAVSGTAEIHVKPDYATVDIGSFASGPSAVAAKHACDQSMARAAKAIKKLGIKPEDIETTGYSVFPVRKKAGQPLAWKVEEAATVRVRNLKIVAEVIDAAVQNGAPEVSNIQFGLDELGPARDKVRARAVEAARAKAASLAKSLGIEVGDVQSIAEEGDSVGLMRYSAANLTMPGPIGGLDSNGRDSISPGQQTVTVTVNVVFTIK